MRISCRKREPGNDEVKIQESVTTQYEVPVDPVRGSTLPEIWEVLMNSSLFFFKFPNY